jgi:hypothetical protein
LAAIVAGAAVAPAASAAQENNSPIIVQGERLTRDAARDSAQSFVRAAGVATGEVPAARWIDPVCPDVTGLTDDGKVAVEAEIRRIAAEMGAPLAEPSCKKNFVISFTSDGGALAREIADRAPNRMAELTPSARAVVLKGGMPIRWWYTTEVRSRHGAVVGGGASNAGGTDQTSPGSGYGAALSGSGLMHYESSILSTLTQRVITSSIVIVDADDVSGRSLKGIAAFAALVGLAEIRDPGAKPAGSILSMFDSPGSIRRMTRQDEAFLKALYRLPLDRTAHLHRGALVRDMTRDLTFEP